MGEGEGVAAHVEGADAALVGQRVDLAAGDVDREQAVLADVFRVDDQRLAVRTPLQRAGRAVPAFGQAALLAACDIHQHDLEAVGLKAGAGHRQVGERAAVGREHAFGIPCGIVGRQVARRGASGGGHAVEVEVGRPGFGLAGDACREHDRLAVRAEAVFLAVAEGFRGHVAIERAGQADRGAADAPVGVQRGREQHGVAAVGPGIPVAHEQAVIHAPARLVFRLRIHPALGAGEVGAVAEDGHAQRDAVAGRRQAEVVDVERQVRHLRRLAAGGALAPDLRAARARREEVNGVARWRPFRVEAAALVRDERLRCRLAVDAGDPDAGMPAVLRHVGGAHRIDDARRVRRHHRAADPFQGGQIFHRQAARGGMDIGGGQGCRQYNEA